MNQSSCASLQSSPVKKTEDTDWEQGSPTAPEQEWPPFFNRDAASATAANGSGTFGRNLVSPVISQPDQMLATGTGLTFWSKNQNCSHIPAQNAHQSGQTQAWSTNGSTYSLFGPNQFSGLIPEYGNRSALNPNAAPWTRTTGYSGPRHVQPDYLTANPAAAAFQYSSHDYQNRTAGPQTVPLNQQLLRENIAALEIQFRDFKLKPKVLTDMKHQLSVQQHQLMQNQDLAGRRLRARFRRPAPVHCVFCVSNGEEEHVCKSHALKDAKGRVTCPVLRMYVCPICLNEGGDNAHTVKYCPKNKMAFKHMMQRVTGDQQQQQSQQQDNEQQQFRYQPSVMYTRK